jgi:release factor glutamine methyltransferase
MVTYTIERLLNEGINKISKREYNNPFLDAQLILCHMLKKDRIYLHIHKDEQVDGKTWEEFFKLVEKRNSGYPLQYITNRQEFMSLDFYVQEGVLVPRPDTETLVEKIIKYTQENLNDKKIKILDIGTGSGAIALSLAHYIKNCSVTAIDISDAAIKTAMINKENLKLENVEIIKLDLFNMDFDEKYDIVVSNPPYIERDTIRSLPVEVSVYEPKAALDGGIDGLDFYRQIAQVFKNIHEPGAILSVEIGCTQRDAVKEIFEELKIFKKIECDRDLSGNDRVITGFL